MKRNKQNHLETLREFAPKRYKLEKERLALARVKDSRRGLDGSRNRSFASWVELAHPDA